MAVRGQGPAQCPGIQPHKNKLVIGTRDPQGGKGIVIDRETGEIVAFQPPREFHRIDPDTITTVAIDPTGTLAATNWTMTAWTS